MKVPDLDIPTMDSKLKFSDRLKALLKTESRQDVDPYIFSEPEPFAAAAAAAKNVKSMQPNAPRAIVKNNKSRGKCIKRRVKIESSGITSMCEDSTNATNCEPDAEAESRSIEMRFPSATRPIQKERQPDHHDHHPHYHQSQHRQSSPHRPAPIQRNSQQSVDNDDPQQLETRRRSRDHTLLYYPRAGDEISDSESSGDELSIYQRHWYAGETDASMNRSSRLNLLRSQLRRRLVQLHKDGQDSEMRLRDRTRCLLEGGWKKRSRSTETTTTTGTTTTMTIMELPSGMAKITTGPLLVGGPCGADGCRQTSLPCTRHCSRHIMLNADQLLFEHCTAKFSDNTQCCVPVFDVAHELPLCPEHARKRDNYHRKSQESKPKKSRKKLVSPIVVRPKNKTRSKKRKRPPSTKIDAKQHFIGEHTDNDYTNQLLTSNVNHTKTLNNLNVSQSTSNSTSLNLGLGLGSLAPLGLGSGLKVELGDHEVFASLDPAEHDFGNVLNNLPADAFNDLFIESRNGEYEPSREEEEELERALEAVDKDVQNLERMGQTHGLLEPALLAQLMSDIAS